MKTKITPADTARYAAEILEQIRDLQLLGDLPLGITEFGQLHTYMDANVGWSDEIEALSADDANTVFNAVDSMLGADTRTAWSAADNDSEIVISPMHDSKTQLLVTITEIGNEDADDARAVILRAVDIERLVAVLTAHIGK